MEYYNLSKALMVLVTQGFLGSYVMMLTEFREPVKRWRLIWFAVVGAVVCINICMILFLDFWNIYKRVGVFTVTAPYILVTLFCSRYKGLRVVFNICTCLWLGCIGNAVAMLVGGLLHDESWTYVLVRGISYLMLYLVLRAIRPYYMQMLKLLDRGWGVLCLIPAVTFATTLYMINNLFDENPLRISVVIFGVAMVCTCAYILMYLFFAVVLRERELNNSRDLMSVQIGAMERQAQINREAEEAMRIQRHDMRHKWTTLSALAEQGDNQAILDFIGAAQRHLDDIASVRWCENSMLNAVFTTYFSQAEREGIRVEAKLAISDVLTVDPAELAMVFANLIENAINACTELPEEERIIICKCIEHPRLMLQVENPYTGEVHFDGRGLPVASEADHGIGTRSVEAFCEKYDAVSDYGAHDGWFSARISL